MSHSHTLRLTNPPKVTFLQTTYRKVQAGAQKLGMETAGQEPSGKAQMQKDRSSKTSYRDMNQSYREKPATPNSPSGTSVTTVYDHLLSPPSPDEEEHDDRVRNDLLDEICNDMGIDDSMDLDFDDFCYQSVQQQRAAGVRFPQHPAAPQKPETVERRPSATTSSSSGYATSDSLCAIAKLTQSITSEQGALPPASSDDEKGEMTDSIKQEPNDSIDSNSENQTDQGKVAASKLLQQRQAGRAQSPYGNTVQNDMKRRRSQQEEETAAQEPCSMASTSSSDSHQQTWPNYNNHTQASQQRVPLAPPQPQPCLDYSHQDDFSMEDMTAPDTMINYSEMPQQPNYYQLPQTARDNLNLGFNVSLHQQQPSNSMAPSAHQTFGRSQSFGNSHGHQATDLTQGDRNSPQPIRPAFQAGGIQQQQQQSGSPFLSCPAPSSSASPGFTRSSSFPGAQVMSHTTAPAQDVHSSAQTSTQKTSSGITPPAASTSFNSSQQGFMQRLVTDKSSAFRSHPLFPLLRDLIIADMNFHEPTFPHQLIRDLPSDFNKLLKNYLSRNPPRGNYQTNQSVESVVMDALKYAHHTLIEKIAQKKSTDMHHQSAQLSQSPAQPPSLNQQPMSNVNEYCEKFEDSVRQNMSQASGYGRQQMSVPQEPSPVSFRPSRIRGPGYSSEVGLQSPISHYNQPLSVDTNCHSPGGTPQSNTSHMAPLPGAPQNPAIYPPNQQYPQPTGYNRQQQTPSRNPYINSHGPPNYTVSPNNPPLPRQHQSMYEMGPPATPTMYNDHNMAYGSPDMYNNCMPPPHSAHHRMHNPIGDRHHLMYVNNINNPNLIKTMMEGGKDMYGDSMSDTQSVMSGHSMQGSTKGVQQGQGKATEGRKHASLPKEAVNIMLNWLREHQDKPYPNDDEKGMLIKQTGLSITQINYWFTNARRRLLPKWRGEDM